jgi:hypothetical protein
LSRRPDLIYTALLTTEYDIQIVAAGNELRNPAIDVTHEVTCINRRSVSFPFRLACGILGCLSLGSYLSAALFDGFHIGS